MFENLIAPKWENTKLKFSLQQQLSLATPRDFAVSVGTECDVGTEASSRELPVNLFLLLCESLWAASFRSFVDGLSLSDTQECIWESASCPTSALLLAGILSENNVFLCLPPLVCQVTTWTQQNETNPAQMDGDMAPGSAVLQPTLQPTLLSDCCMLL